MLFDISVKNAAEIILSNKKTTKNERLGDVSFLEDQRGERKAVMVAEGKKYTKVIKRQHKELESAIRRNITSVNTTVNPEILSNGDDVDDADDGKDIDYQVVVYQNYKQKPDFIPSMLPRKILKESFKCSYQKHQKPYLASNR